MTNAVHDIGTRPTKDTALGREMGRSCSLGTSEAEAFCEESCWIISQLLTTLHRLADFLRPRTIRLAVARSSVVFLFPFPASFRIMSINFDSVSFSSPEAASTAMGGLTVDTTDGMGFGLESAGTPSNGKWRLMEARESDNDRLCLQEMTKCVCVKAKKECLVQHQSSKRFTVPATGLLLIRQGTDRAFASVYAPASLVPEHVRDKWLSEQHSVEGWIERFRNLQQHIRETQAASTELEDEDEDVKSISPTPSEEKEYKRSKEELAAQLGVGVGGKSELSVSSAAVVEEALDTAKSARTQVMGLGVAVANMKSTMTDQSNHIASLEHMVQNLARDIASVADMAREAAPQAEVQAFAHKVTDNLRDIVAEFTVKLQKVSGGFGYGGLGKRLASPPVAQGTSDSALQDMAKRVKTLEDRAGQSGLLTRRDVSLGAWEATDEQEFSALMTRLNPDHNFSGIVDAVSLLEEIQTTELSESLKDWKAAGEMGYTNRSETAVVRTLGLLYPTLLGKRVTSTDREAACWGSCPKYADFGDTVTGLKARVARELPGARMAIEGRYNADFGPTDTGHGVAQTALSLSADFVNQLFAFMEATYAEMTGANNFSSAQAWALVTRLGARPFEDMSVGRRAAAKMSGGNSRDKVCDNYLYATLRAHRIMKEYMDAGIKDHPSISAEYIRFLATNSGKNGLEQTKAKVSSLEAQVASLTKRLEAVQKKADSSGNKVDELQKQVTAQGKRIAKGGGSGN